MLLDFKEDDLIIKVCSIYSVFFVLKTGLENVAEDSEKRLICHLKTEKLIYFVNKYTVISELV